jgi:hypothetical protein
MLPARAIEPTRAGKIHPMRLLSRDMIVEALEALARELAASGTKQQERSCSPEVPLSC